MALIQLSLHSVLVFKLQSYRQDPVLFLHPYFVKTLSYYNGVQMFLFIIQQLICLDNQSLRIKVMALFLLVFLVHQLT
jgi:hypothetical protein